VLPLVYALVRTRLARRAASASPTVSAA
jgi:hypothetical protein